MSRYFVNDPPVAVPEYDPTAIISDTPPNVIYIRAKMDMETDAKVKGELIKLGADNQTVETRLGANQMALLLHNIVRWEGPDLGAVPCTPENIRTLDPTEPHIVLVLEEIARRNKRPEAPPASKKSTEPTSTNATGSGSAVPRGRIQLQSANGTPKSNLQNAITGHLNKSDD